MGILAGASLIEKIILHLLAYILICFYRLICDRYF